jgi:SPP1 gp7 family putative phage head morphogenesis protein
MDDELATLQTTEKTRRILATAVRKALPSQPVWTINTPDYGFWDGNRNELIKLMACYQKIAEVHGAIDINAKGITAAKPTLMKIVTSGAKNLHQRKLKRLDKARAKRITKQWTEPNLCRKSLSDEEELVEVEAHPLLDALHSNEQDNDFHGLLRLTVVNLSIFGIAFWRKQRNAIGTITSYQYLPTYNVSPQRGDDGHVSGWLYCSTFGDYYTDQVFVASEDMVVIRWPSVSDPHAGGDSPLRSALKKIEISGKWEDHQNWILNNRARPDAVIQLAEEAGTEAAEREEKRFNDKFRGAGNGRVHATTGKFVPIAYPLTDLASLKFNEALADAVMFALGIPKSFSTNDSNKATMAASMEQWARQSLSPIVALLESSLNKLSKDFDDDSRLLWVFENVIPQDRAAELAEETFELSKWNQALIAGAVTDDEYRERVLGLEPMAEEDKPEPTPPPTINQIIQAKPEEEEKEEAEEVEEDEPAKAFDLLGLNIRVSKGQLDRATAINIAAYSLKLSQAEAKNLVTFNARETKKGKKRLKVLKPMSAKPLTDEIVRSMDKQKSHYMAQLTGNHPKALDGADIVTKSASDLPEGFTRDADWDSTDAMLYKPYLHMQGAQTAEGRIKAFVDIGAKQGVFDVVPQQIDEAVKKASLKFAKSTNETTETELNDALEDLRGKIKDGLVDGDPIPLMKKKVEDVFENISSERAENIARTETSRAMHESQRITAKASGLVKGFKLLASSECCDECAEMDGKEIGMDEKFNGDDDYDESMLPIHPKCRCTALEILDLGALGDD